MIKIKVYAPPLCNFEYIDENGYMALPEGAVLNDVYKRLGIPFPLKKIFFASVNYTTAGLKTRLADGDVVSFFWGLAGG